MDQTLRLPPVRLPYHFRQVGSRARDVRIMRIEDRTRSNTRYRVTHSTHMISPESGDTTASAELSPNLLNSRLPESSSTRPPLAERTRMDRRLTRKIHRAGAQAARSIATRWVGHDCIHTTMDLNSLLCRT